MNLGEITAQTRALAEKAIQASRQGLPPGLELHKAITAATALGGINLDQPAQLIVPILSPFHASIARKPRPGDDSTRWKQITKVTLPKMSVGEEAAGKTVALTTASKTVAMAESAIGGKVTRKAVAMGVGFDEALARETRIVLETQMRGMEILYLGANVTALGAVAGVTLAERNGLGALAAATYFVKVAALTLSAANRETIDRAVDYDGTDAFIDGKAHTGINPEADGWGALSTEVSLAIAGGGDALKITWTPKATAAAYAVFIGTATGNPALKCEAIVTQSSISVKSLNTTGDAATVVATESSADSLTFDGMVPLLAASGSGAHVKAISGKLSGASGEVTQIQDAFAAIYDNAKLGDLRLLVSGQDGRILTRLGISQDSVRVIVGVGENRSSMVQGFHVGEILNSVTGERCPVETQPNLPGGMILMLPRSIPWAAPGEDLDSAFDYAVSYGPERWDYASTTSTGPIFPFEIREMGALRSRLPAGCALLYDIFKG